MYGEKLRDQVEECLKFYETGAAPRKNMDVMAEVARQLASTTHKDEIQQMEVKKEEVNKTTVEKKKQKKEKRKKMDEEEEAVVEAEEDTT